MNLDSLSSALAQISYLVANLNKKNHKSSTSEINQLIVLHGNDADQHLLRCLFSAVNFSSDAGKGTSDQHQAQYLSEELKLLFHKPNFVSNLCFAIEHPLNHQKTLQPSYQLPFEIAETLHLSGLQEIVFGIALTHCSIQDIKTSVAHFLRKQLTGFITAVTSPGEEGNPLQNIDIDLLHFVLLHVVPSSDQFSLKPELFENFLKTLRKEFLRQKAPVVLIPLLYPDQEDIVVDKLLPDKLNIPKMESSLAEIIVEKGYGVTSSVDYCRNQLMQVGVAELTPIAIAQVIGMMTRTPVGLAEVSLMDREGTTGTTWIIDNFTKAVMDLVPALKWRDVLAELDHPGFEVSGELGLKILAQAMIRGLKEPVPAEYLFKTWRNAEGQLSLFEAMLRYPSILNIGEYQGRLLSTDALKTPPDDTNAEVTIWRNIDFIETLLNISESLYTQTQQLFKLALQCCPDVLTLALLQVPSMCKLKAELLSQLFPLFLSNHANSAAILHFAWHSQPQTNTVKAIIINCMAEWYLRGDPNDSSRLSRILDVAQDLKALSMLLSASPFAFVIDLACLASRREFLKLEKWLSDKIREHGEVFIRECAAFLERKCPALAARTPEERSKFQSKQPLLPPETISIMLTCLNACTGNVSSELADTIVLMVSQGSVILRARPGASQPAGNAGSSSSMTIPSAPGGPTSSNPLMSGGLRSYPGSSAFNHPGLGGLGGGHFGSNNAMEFQGAFNIPGVGPLGGFGNPEMGGSSVPFGTSMPSMVPSSPSKMFPSMPPSIAQSAFGAFPPLPSMGAPGGDVPESLMAPNGSAPGSSKDASASTSFSEGQDLENFPKDIETEANGYFQHIYNTNAEHPTLTPDELLQVLKRFKDSTVQREREVFQCMLRNLFDEYRFFHTYPDKELQTTAVLFGGLIGNDVVDGYWKMAASRYLLEAFRKEPNSKIFLFGLTALDRCKMKLREMPAICEKLSQMPNFSQLPPYLVRFVEFGQKGASPPLDQQQGAVLWSESGQPGVQQVQTPSAISKAPGKPSIAGATNIDTLQQAADARDKQIQVPSQALQDKVLFIFNNLSQSNMVQKTDELRKAVGQEYMPWVAQYLVMKRASIEPNFHTLYANFVDALQGDLSRMVTKETYRNIRVLLHSNKDDSSFSDRTLLKNLGHWLGLLTLARNQPILYRDLELKLLLYEAYVKGATEMLYVVPFAAKILESCAKSRVFKPPSPWSLGLMNVLAEMHAIPELKLNLKFEVEVLCKALSISIEELQPGNYLTTERDYRPAQLPEPAQQETAAARPLSQPSPTGAAAAAAPPPEPQQAEPNKTITPEGEHVKQRLPLEVIPTNMNQLRSLFIVNDQLPIFQTFPQPQVKQQVYTSITRAIEELLPPVVDRSVKIAVNTCEQIIKKDFALDPDENRMRAAANHMVGYLTAGMALITCYEPLYLNISNNLKTTFMQVIRQFSMQAPKELIQQTADELASDNVELGVSFISKTAVHRAHAEINQRLSMECEVRQRARTEGRAYCDHRVLTYQAERMPELIRMRIGAVSSQQIKVYEEFAKHYPGFGPPDVPTQDNAIDAMCKELQIRMNTTNAPPIQTLFTAACMLRNNPDQTTAITLLRKALELILSFAFSSVIECVRDSCLCVFRYFLESKSYGPEFALREVTKMLTESQTIRYGFETVLWLIRQKLVSIPGFDIFLAQSVEAGQNMPFITDFLVAYCGFDSAEQHGLSQTADADFCQTINVLRKIRDSYGPQAPERLVWLLDRLDRPGGATSVSPPQEPQQPRQQFPLPVPQEGPTPTPPVSGDPPGLYENTEFLLREWINLYNTPQAGRDSTAAFEQFGSLMCQHGILKNDDMMTRFFRICTEICVDQCYRDLTGQSPLGPGNPSLVRLNCYHRLDGFARLICVLIRRTGGEQANHNTKVNLLNKVLGIVSNVLVRDHETKNKDFQQLPFHRIYMMLLIELMSPELVFEAISFQVLTSFCNTYHMVQPAKAPGFAFSWLELISHRIFIGKLLADIGQQKGWPMYHQLIIDLFRFLAPFLRNADLTKSMQLFYKGTLRVMLILLHDFPEFFCDYYFTLCNVIPPNCVQLRNLILSAFPRSMRLPDPFTPNLKVDMLTEITQMPRGVQHDWTKFVKPAEFKQNLDSYLRDRTPVTFLSDLQTYLQLNELEQREQNMKYDIELVNSVVLYVGHEAIRQIHAKSLQPGMGTIPHSAAMDVFQSLAINLDTQGRYLFLNAIANQLRYPNSHTHYFSCTLLYLFAEANIEAIQEQITRILLERLIVNRPHPWGLLVTFIELLRNQHYNFWDHNFVHCAPEIEQLFESVARSCSSHPPPNKPIGTAPVELK